MAGATFRIDKVKIEGFKAFTSEQSFDFGGRHVFLFGPNGFGKTSIVEAVRWCLFGLASRPGEIVKNQFYNGPCIVQMTLNGPDGQWTMQRRLRTSGGDSDRAIRDPSGNERNLEDVFPELSRIGPREGTHVIYAAQQPSSRRPEADITDFSYVVYRYLGLEEVPRLSDVLVALSNSWKIQEEEVSGDVDDLGDEIAGRLQEIEEDLSRIVADPPWGAELTPANADTRKKIDGLALDAEKLGAQCSLESLDGLSPSDKLYEIEAAVDVLLSGELGGLNKTLAERSAQLQNAESLLSRGRTADSELMTHSDVAVTTKNELESLLNSQTIDELGQELLDTEAAFQRMQLKLDVARSSLKYIAATGEGDPTYTCPTCDTHVAYGQLKLQLEDVASSGDDHTQALLSKRDELRGRFSKANELVELKEETEASICKLKSALGKVFDEAAQKFSLSPPRTLDSLDEQ